MDIVGGAVNLVKRIPWIGRKLNRLLAWLLRIIWHIPFISKLVNRFVTNHLATRTTPRPRPYSLWSHVDIKKMPAGVNGPVSDYTSWPALTDKLFSGRHLKPVATEFPASPTLKQAADLFMRPEGVAMKTDRSSLLFMFFAQWFTDSVLRVDGTDRRKNTSNHYIDLCQIYGLTEIECRALRSKNDGQLKSQPIKGAEYLVYLHEEDGKGGLKVKDEFKDLSYTDRIDAIMKKFSADKFRKEKMYATGLDNGNGSIGYVAINTLFMREHNRIARALSAVYQNDAEWKRLSDPTYFDERLFQTARMINTVLLLKLVIEEYINHISGHKLFRLDHRFAENQHWYRPNWITLEFNLLYRWHGMVPDTITINQQPYDQTQFRFNNGLLESVGIEALITHASTQAAGKIGLQNTPEFLRQAEEFSIIMARDFRLASYNDYREQFGLWRMKEFSDLTTDGVLQTQLAKHYIKMDNLEFLVGLFGETPDDGALFGDLMNTMISYDAFTQIYTNPLLSKNIFNEETFTQTGMEIINTTHSLQQIAERNAVAGVGVTASFS